MMVVGRRGIEPLQSKTADLQSAELTTCSTYPRGAPSESGCGTRGAPGRSPCSVGADDGTRTRNRRFTKPLLYQLSYVGGRRRTPQSSPRRNGHHIRASGPRSSALDLGGGRPSAASPSAAASGGSADPGAAALGGPLGQPRCAAASKTSTEPATAALSDSIRPRIGIRTRRSQRRRIGGRQAAALAPDHEDERPPEVGLAVGQGGPGVRPDDPEAPDVQVGERARAGRRPGPAGGAPWRPPTP